MQTVTIILGAIGVWSLVLSIGFAYIFRHFRRLSKDVGTGNLITVIDKLIDIEQNNSKSIVDLNARIDKIDKDILAHIQKVGLVKFNPFDELGGDHSFSLAMLDGKNNGFILTGLHSRDRTRIYAKPIIEASSKLELSKEEAKALKKALKD